jgi:hypothetical protein
MLSTIKIYILILINKLEQRYSRFEPHFLLFLLLIAQVDRLFEAFDC